MFTFIIPWRHFRQCAKQFILSCLKRLTKVNGWSILFWMTNYCKENMGMVIHTDSFANERRFVCILKCRRTRQTWVVSGWTLLRCLKAPKHSPVGVVVCVRRTRSTQPPTPLPPKKGRRQYKFALPRFRLKYLAAPIPALQNLSSPSSPSAPRFCSNL